MSWQMRAEVVSGQGVRYSVYLPGIEQVTVFVGFPGEGNPMFGIAPCIWQITVPSIEVDESVAIDHSGAVHCQAPPEWTISDVTIPRGETSCTGTLSLVQYEMAKLPFVSRWPDAIEEFVTDMTCGLCDRFCRILCVKRGNAEERTRVEFVWSDDDLVWYANDDSGHKISLYEEYGNCYLLLEEIGGGEFEGDLLLIDSYACSLGMDLTATGTGTNFIAVSCNRCSCWKYVCGTCRCVCKKLCVTGVLDGEYVEPMELEWDPLNFRWGDETFGVSLGNDEDGNCALTITGFDGSVTIDNACGSQIAFNVSEDISDMLTSGVVNYLYGYCQPCDGNCSQGSCLTLCPDVPPVVFCEVTPTEWALMLGCNPAVLCFSPITIPMGLVFVGSGASGEWRWIGYGIISCHDCNPSTSPRNYLVTVDFGCDGQGMFRVERPGVTPCVHNFSAPLPCGYSDIWDIEFETDSACGDGLDGCCDEAAFHGHITT